MRLVLSAWCIILAALLGLSPGCAEKNVKQLDSKTKSNKVTIQLIDLDGQPFEIWNAGRSSAITVVVFTRTDCPISNRYAPEIRQLYEKYHPQGVEFFLVYVDPREQLDAIQRHLAEFAYPCRGLQDPKQTLVAHCHATATPEAVVFGKDRTIHYQGRVDDLYTDLGQPRAEPTTHDLADAIESIIHGRPIANPRTKAIGCLIADLKD